MLPILLLAIVFVPMVLESRRSRRHERSLRAAGAIEPADDVYGVMLIAYPLCFLLPIGEAVLRGRTMSPFVIAGGTLFGLAKALKYWAIATLGPRWTFRILVPPSSERTLSGPYRFLRHPNYIAVAGEIAAIGLMSQASFTGPLAFLFFAALMALRVQAEERALGIRRG